VTGVYSAAYAVVRVVVKLIQSGWRAVYPTLSRLRSEDLGRYARLAATGLRYGSLGVWLVVALGVGMAEPFMGMLFPHNDMGLVWVYQVLMWSTPLLLSETYANTLLLVEQRPRQSLTATLLHLATWALLLPWMIVQWQAAGAAWATVVSAGVGASVAFYFLAQTPVAPRVAHLVWPAGIGILTIFLASSPPWPDGVRMVLALGGYIGLVWCCGMVTMNDIQGVHRALFGPRA
jgi:O-antigen/teichoic acid export membrane protein